MGNFKQGLKQFIVNNPEAALEILHGIITNVPKVIEAGVAIKDEGVCNYLERKIENLFSKKEDAYILPVYNTTERTTPAYSVFSYPMMPQIDYGEQLETLQPVVSFIHQICKESNISWCFGTGENRYVASFVIENTQYNCLVELESNNHVALEILTDDENDRNKYLSIGESGQPIHPELNRKLSDLFFLAEESALKISKATNRYVVIDENTRKMALFLNNLIKVTKSKVAKWKQEPKTNNSYTTVVNKKSGAKIIIKFICDENLNTDVRVAQWLNGKLSKLLHIKDSMFEVQAEVKILLKRLGLQIIQNLSVD